VTRVVSGVLTRVVTRVVSGVVTRVVTRVVSGVVTRVVRRAVTVVVHGHCAYEFSPFSALPLLALNTSNAAQVFAVVKFLSKMYDPCVCGSASSNNNYWYSTHL